VAAYEAHHAEVFAFLVRAIRDRPAAEELLQETYVRFAKEAREGRDPLEVRTWLYRVAADLAVKHSGRRGTEPEAGAVGQEQAVEMERVLEGLSPDGRLALLLSCQGFSGEDIAVALGRSAEATRSLLYRARARVRLRRGLFEAASR
jgi:RNA polymerase sigma-70 factor (ECF subfamily)